jgi:hypothetical protein
MQIKIPKIFFCFLAITSFVDALSQISHLIMANEPNPPQWPSTVKLIRETDDVDVILAKIKETEDGYDEEAETYTSLHHFSDRRWALLFAPGVYRKLDFQIGYYVQLAGLGRSSKDVVFQDCEKGPHVPALNRHIHAHGTCLDTFWRSAENFSTHASNGMKWAVSQAAPLRRVHVANDLHLHDGEAYASGGHLANSVIDGHTFFGGQQQYLSRNVEFKDGVSGGAWSLVFLGCTGQVPPEAPGNEDSASITITKKPRVRVEKPYVALQEDGKKFNLHVPIMTRDENLVSGAHIDGELEEVRDFSNVRVVSATEFDATSRIQEALDDGKDVVLAPGIFHLNQTLKMKTNNQVLLGLGLATLVAPVNESPCLQVMAGSEGVRVAGIMLEASERSKDRSSEKPSTTLLEWGEEGVLDPGSSDNPGSMFDIFCRVGGGHGARHAIAVDTMMKVHSGNIVGDNIWLWRADHSDLSEGEEANYSHISPIFHQNEEHENRVQTGIIVSGDDVTFSGLAVEHANGHQTVWSGERGSVHFYQCELPYDVSSEYGTDGYRGYLVDNGVKNHELYGPGVYSNFRNSVVMTDTAMEYPEHDGLVCINPFTVHLDNNGTILSIANGKGPAAIKQGKPARMTNHPEKP